MLVCWLRQAKMHAKVAAHAPSSRLAAMVASTVRPTDESDDETEEEPGAGSGSGVRVKSKKARAEKDRRARQRAFREQMSVARVVKKWLLTGMKKRQEDASRRAAMFKSESEDAEAVAEGRFKRKNKWGLKRLAAELYRASEKVLDNTVRKIDRKKVLVSTTSTTWADAELVALLWTSHF